MSKLAERLERLLSDEVMALLALLTLLTTVVPFVYESTPVLDRGLFATELVVVTLFVLEYVSGLLLAPDKRRFALNPWRLLDAFIIVAVVVSMLPLPVDALGASPVLRLVRFVRVAVLGTRSGRRLTAAPPDAGVGSGEMPLGAVGAYALDLDQGEARFESVGWDQALDRVGSEQDDWLLFEDVGPDHLGPIAERLGVPVRVLHDKLFEAAFPSLDRLERFATLFTWFPHLAGTPGDATAVISRTGLLLVGSAQNVAVLARGRPGLIARLERRLRETDEGAPVLVNATHALMKEVVRAYARVTEHLETRLLRIEAAEPTLRDRDFLQRTFALRGEVSRVRTTLRHLTGVTRNLNSRRVAIRGFDTADLPQFQLLASEATDLFERVDDLSTNLAALVDMRLNVSSFQMNRVMRLLAILTTLALIPAIAGGMLGMNLIDNPWPASLAMVAFWVGTGMLAALYLFAIKGWLR